jgi:hypothetical protein
MASCGSNWRLIDAHSNSAMVGELRAGWPTEIGETVLSKSNACLDGFPDGMVCGARDCRVDFNWHYVQVPVMVWRLANILDMAANDTDWLFIVAQSVLPNGWPTYFELANILRGVVRFRPVGVSQGAAETILPNSNCDKAFWQDGIANCPDPSNTVCECRSHYSVKQLLAWGKKLRGGNWHDWFRMEPA